MPRLLGPDLGGRLAYIPTASVLRNAAGLTAVVYSDAAGTVLADILTYDGTETPGAAISGSALTVDAQSLLPKFWFPNPLVDTVYVRINGGNPIPVNADYDRRFDENVYNQTATGGATNVDFVNGRIVKLTLNVSTTITFTDPPPSGVSGMMTIYVIQGTGGSRVPTFADTLWPAGAAPTFSTGVGKVDLATFETLDGGATYYGNLAGLDYR